MKALARAHLRFLVFLAAACCAISTPVTAETLYKTIGPDGRVEYTDRPPADGKAAKTLNFADLPATPLPDSVLRYREQLQKGMQNRLANAGKRGGVQLFSAAWCGYCRKAKSWLDGRGIAYTEIDIDTPDGGMAFAQAGSASGIPLLLAGEQRVQGFSAAAYESVFRAAKAGAGTR